MLWTQYRMFKAQQKLFADTDAKARINKALNREHKIEAVSGVQNLSLDYELGARLVQIDEEIEDDTSAFTEAGGSQTGGLVENPCPADQVHDEE
jgi:hypothetical protein